MTKQQPLFLDKPFLTHLVNPRLNRFRSKFDAGVILVSLATALLAGCQEAPPAFEINRVASMSLEISRDIPTAAALDDVTGVIGEWFGTPAAPRWPSELLDEPAHRDLVSIERLDRAAGAVTSDQADDHTGLYREHCVICHSVSGSGAGPASRYQVPYPRDFRAGVFKWKSTPRNQKPTRDDLHRVLEKGIPGSPMPSFASVTPAQREALVDYVIYLSIRGEVERKLLALAVDELDYDTTAPDDDSRLTLISAKDTITSQNDPPSNEPIEAETSKGRRAALEVLRDVVRSWSEAEPSIVPAPPELNAAEMTESVARGDALFHGAIANCAGCHGPGGGGGLPLLDYDDWTKEFTTRIGITPDDRDAIKPFRKAGALKPRKIDPRKLTGGTLHGGGDPETLYRRIEHGIAGTPMPGLQIDTAGDEKLGITPAEAWDLVHYVRSLVIPQQ